MAGVLLQNLAIGYLMVLDPELVEGRGILIGDGMSRVIVFDVIETMLDISALEPHFERVFGDKRVLREWFSQLLLYSEVATIACPYFDFTTIADAPLELTAASHKLTLSATDKEQISKAMLSLP